MLQVRRGDPIAHRLQALGVTRAAADRLSRQGTYLAMSAGDVLCRAGERGLEAFLILEGAASVQLADGGTVEIGPADVVGELATLDPSRTRNATVVATTDLTVLVFDVRTFRGLADDAGLRDLLRPERVAA